LSNLKNILNLYLNDHTIDILAPVNDRSPPAGLGLLMLSAFWSGFAALTLELLWGRLLALTFGSSQFAVATVLAGFMLGLGLGSGLGGRLADRSRRPARIVTRIELVLAVIGPLWTLGLLRLPAVAAKILPTAHDATGWPFLIGRLTLGVVLLLVPTTLMGAGFPLLARASARGLTELHHGIGRLVAAATLGGVAGVVATGLALIPTAGVPAALWAAVAAHALAAVAAAMAQGRTGVSVTGDPTKPVRMLWPRGDRLLLGAALLSGALVLGAETLWHRALLMVMANSTVTLTLLLAITLAGLSIGAAAVSPLLIQGRPLRWWAAMQSVAALLLVCQALFLPNLAAAARWIRPDSGWPRVLVPPLVIGGGLILPVAIVLGAAWPLLLAATTPRVHDGGRRLGAMGIANSVGAALGAVLAGFVLLPALGFGRALLVLAGCHAAMSAGAIGAGRRWTRSAIGCSSMILIAVAAVGPRFAAVPLPSMVGDPATAVVEYRESPAGTVVVTEHRPTGALSMFVDNNAVIGASYDALKIVRMLGLVPCILHRSPESVLVIGYGAGVTTATVAAVPGVRTIDVAEIVPDVVTAAGLFSRFNHRVDQDPRVRMVPNDGRNLLQLTRTTYDVITCDPVHPLYGSASLYSLDYFELAKRRLNPGGVVCQYLPLHRMPTPEFQRAIATFDAAFDQTWVLFGLGHAMLVGGDGLELDWTHWQRTLEEFQRADDLAASALATPGQIAALIQLDPEASRQLARGEPSTDLRPHLEFLAPAAYQPGLWRANAQLLVESYRSPLPRIRHLPPELHDPIKRLIAGKRLLLFSLLDRADGDPEGAVRWLRQALAIAGDDPEIQHYARQLKTELESLQRDGQGPG
jgi:predicted membrane-bound spermidine synthase